MEPRGREQHRWANREAKCAGAHESKRGQRTSFKTPRHRGKAKVDLQNQFASAACNVKRWLRLLAQQSSRMERSQSRIRRTRGEAGTLG
jgi:hypothetical protein